MTPTPELRFVERWDTDEITFDTRIIRILQQKWAVYWSDDMGGGVREEEWRDVPCVKEEV